MKFIIDTNILISSLLKESTTRELLLNDLFDYYLPQIVLTEVRKYLPYIVEKSGLSEREIDILLKTILDNIYQVPFKEYEAYIDEAMKIIGKIDEKDTQFIALSLAIDNDGIWSNDKHFEKQTKIKIYKTIDVLNLLEEQSE